MPVSGGDPTRGGEEVDRVRCYTGGPGRAIQPGRGRRPAICLLPAFEPARCYRCCDGSGLCRSAAVTLAAAVSSGPLVVRIGTFLPKSGLAARRTRRGCSARSRSSPRRGTAVRSSDSPSRWWNRRTAGSLTVTLRSDVRFHTGEPITAPVVRDLLAKKLRACPEIARHRGARRSAPAVLAAQAVVGQDRRPEHDARRQRRTGTDLALRTGPFKLVSTEPMVLERFDGYYQGEPRSSGWRCTKLHDPSCGVDGHDAARGEFPPRGQPRRHRLRRSRRRHPRLPAAQALLHRAGLQHAPSGAEAPRGAGRHQRGDRSQRARSQCACAGTGGLPKGPFWPYHWAYPQGRFPVAFNPEAAKLRLDGVGFEGRVPAARNRCRRVSRFTCLVARRRRQVRAHCAAGATAALCRSASTCRSSR